MEGFDKIHMLVSTKLHEGWNTAREEKVAMSLCSFVNSLNLEFSVLSYLLTNVGMSHPLYHM